MLEITPMTLKEANAYVEQNHRHHGPVVGHKFSIGCSDGEKIVGVAIVGRPVARHLDDGWTLEVNRLCTDGTRNACSMLYAAAWRAAPLCLADFTYYQPPNRQLYGSHAPYYAEQSGVPWEFVVEDVKSKATRTAKYAIKKKMLKDRFGYDITEV